MSMFLVRFPGRFRHILAILSWLEGEPNQRFPKLGRSLIHQSINAFLWMSVDHRTVVAGISRLALRPLRPAAKSCTARPRSDDSSGCPPRTGARRPEVPY